MAPTSYISKLVSFILCVHQIASDPNSANCKVQTCVSISSEGFIQNSEGKQCLWCEKSGLIHSELFALVNLAQNCAENGELVRPRNNWCLGHETKIIPFDRIEKNGCEEDMITDPCSGHILQRTLSSGIDGYEADPWSGLECSHNGMHIKEINLRRKTKMTCEIGSFNLSPLKKLQTFHLVGTGISGNIETSLWLFEMKQLRFIDLSKNKLTGSLDVLFQQHRQLLLGGKENQEDNNEELKKISLSNDKEVLFLDENERMMDKTCIGLCRLVIFDIAENKIQGPIPSVLGHSPHLQHLVLNHNSFTGTLPLSLLEHDTLKRIDIRQNAMDKSELE